MIPKRRVFTDREWANYGDNSDRPCDACGAMDTKKIGPFAACRLHVLSSDPEESENGYNELIAKAALEYRSARGVDAMERTEETKRQEVLAFAKLSWLLDAKFHQWDPNKYGN